MDILQTLSRELGLALPRIEKAVGLLDEGNTVPFIARYRKEVTGSMDDGELRALSERLNALRALEARRGEISALISGQGKLTPELTAALDGAKTLTELEDIYRPFRPKRRTRASVARERGLEDLATLLIMQEASYAPSLDELASAFVDAEREVPTLADAYSGACDIIAEDISDSAAYRRELRSITSDFGFIASRDANGVDNSGGVYAMYSALREPVKTVPPHRVLAMNRGEKEGKLRVSIELDDDIALNYLAAQVVNPSPSPAKKYVMAAVVDAYRRLIAPSVEREIRGELTDTAGEGAIKNFSQNLRQLLMQPPVRGHVTLGFDPGYRTGCKVAVVDETGRVLETGVVYPTKPREDIEGAKKVIKRLIRDHSVSVIAIGNGTAGRESEQFIASLLREIPQDCKYTIVNEAGASVYSASELGAEEFPQLDVTERSAVSLARRLQDPLAELTKIDPKSVGVGQYQHDMKEARLDEALSGVVEDCVNTVGVELNTASWTLLSHVAGVSASTAKGIVRYREANGKFTSRAEILSVPRLGARTYEQCAGFLRVSGSDEILDNTAVHPESYATARKLLRRLRLSEDDLRRGRTTPLAELSEKDNIGDFCEELGVGEPTLRDIIGELCRPGRDAREELPPPSLRRDVLDIADLSIGMELSGTVRNVIDFGAFVDIGVHEDGLVHVSEICRRFIRHPSEVLHVGDEVKVWVLNIDRQRGRIGLTMIHEHAQQGVQN